MPVWRPKFAPARTSRLRVRRARRADLQQRIYRRRRARSNTSERDRRTRSPCTSPWPSFARTPSQSRGDAKMPALYDRAGTDAALRAVVQTHHASIRAKAPRSVARPLASRQCDDGSYAQIVIRPASAARRVNPTTGERSRACSALSLQSDAGILDDTRPFFPIRRNDRA